MRVWTYEENLPTSDRVLEQLGYINQTIYIEPLETKMTQHEKIFDLCKDGQFHCQNEFRARFIYSPHKRRNEIAGKVNESDPRPVNWHYDWVKIKCQHNVENQFDYRLIVNPDYSAQIAKEAEPTDEDRIFYSINGFFPPKEQTNKLI